MKFIKCKDENIWIRKDKIFTIEIRKRKKHFDIYVEIDDSNFKEQLVSEFETVEECMKCIHELLNEGEQ